MNNRRRMRITPDALDIADRAVVADIELFGVIAQRLQDGRPVYDTRPMLDPREHSDQVLEMARQALAYARDRGLVTELPGQPHLLAINPRVTA